MHVSLRLLPALLLLGLAPAARAQNPCAPGTATSELFANNVRARLYNDGRLFWKGGGQVYNVPAAPPGLPALPNAIFASHLWIGGRVNGEVRAAAGHQTGSSELVPGPLGAQGQALADCTPYDRIFRITRADLDALARGTVTPAVREWPWMWGAPVVDGDGNPRNYNPAGGDRPELLGSETHWWVMNAMGPHPYTGSAPFPLEVQVTAFGAASAEPALDDATLYRYRLVWRGAGTLTDAFVGLLTDADLGFAGDDYVGVDSALALSYTYNADDFDEGDGGYGAAPPAVGTAFVEVPRAGVREGAYSAQWHRKNDPRWGTPAAGAGAQAFVNRLLGLSSDGSPHPRCGDALDPQYLSCGTTRFTFTGFPETRTGWTMLAPAPATTPLVPSDHRMLISAGPFTLQQGDPQDVVIAVTWARGRDHLNSVARLRAATQRVRDVWRATGFQGLPAYTLAAPRSAPAALSPADRAAGQPATVTFSWTPVPGASAYTLELAQGGSLRLQSYLGTRASVTFDPGAVGQAVAWRVRAENRAGSGPWSALRRFTIGRAALESRAAGFLDFLTTHSGAGPLVPASYGAFAFNDSGFPNPTTRAYAVACQQDRPAPNQQSTLALDPERDGCANFGWGVFTPGNYTTYEQWRGIVTRNGANLAALGGHTFEWRFSGSSVAGRPYDTSGPATMPVPFELWSTGTRPGPEDDVRMIPLVCEAACGAGNVAGVFDAGGDSPLSGGTDDPLTDAVTWHFPNDRTPGQAGYLAWEREMQAGGTGLRTLGTETLTRVSLLGWNMLPPTGLRTPRPENGTVFRIVTQTGFADAPVPAAPADGAGVSAGPVTLYWSEPARTTVRTVEMAREATFTRLVERGTSDSSAYTVREPLAAGQRYFWRVQVTADGIESAWSSVSSFIAGAATGVTPHEAAPEVLTLEAPRPHPVAVTASLRLGVPDAGALRVRLYDLLGREVARLNDGAAAPGWTSVPLDASALAPGVYVLRAEANGVAVTRPIVVAR